MTTVDEIKAWLKRWGVDEFPTVSDLAYASEHKDCRERLTFLLTEIERLETVVDAVQAYAPVEENGRIYDTSSEWKAVLDALAAYEAATGGQGDG